MSTQTDAVEVTTVLYHFNSHSRLARSFPPLSTKAQITPTLSTIAFWPPLVCLLCLPFGFIHIQRNPRLKIDAPSACCGQESNLQIDLCETTGKGRIATVNNVGPVPAIRVYLSLYLHCPSITIFLTYFFPKALVTCRDNDMMQETLLRCVWTSSTSQLHPEHERTTTTTKKPPFQSSSIFVWSHCMLSRQSKQWLLNNVPNVKHKNKYSCMFSSAMK